MRRSFARLLTVLVFAHGLPAQSNHDWANVESLKPGTTVVISLWSGEGLGGRVGPVNDTRLQLATLDRTYTKLGPNQEVDRAAIRKIVCVRETDMPDGSPWIFVGTVGGGLIGGVSGAIYDKSHQGNTGNVLVGGARGALIGFVVTGIAVIAVRGARKFRDNVVYEGKPPGPTPKN